MDGLVLQPPPSKKPKPNNSSEIRAASNNSNHNAQPMNIDGNGNADDDAPFLI